MRWHGLALTETDVVHVVVDDLLALLPGAVGVAVLSRSPGARAAPGDVEVRAVSGMVPGLAGSGRSVADELPLLSDGPPDDSDRERGGWAFAVTPAPTGPGMLMWVPLGRGRMCGTLLIAAVAVDDCLQVDAVTAAMHAATAIGVARQREHLQIALASRDVIGQAKGIVMARWKVTADTAFALLVGASQRSNSKLRDVCAGVCATGELDLLVGASS